MTPIYRQQKLFFCADFLMISLSKVTNVASIHIWPFASLVRFLFAEFPFSEACTCEQFIVMCADSHQQFRDSMVSNRSIHQAMHHLHTHDMFMRLL